MANIIKHKRTTTPGAIPASLEDGELAFNLADRALFYKDAGGVVRPLYFFPVSFVAAVGYPAVQVKKINVVDPLVKPSSKVSVSWDDVVDADENDPELVDLIFKVACNNGSFDLTIASGGRSVIGGDFKLKYQIL